MLSEEQISKATEVIQGLVIKVSDRFLALTKAYQDVISKYSPDDIRLVRSYGTLSDHSDEEQVGGHKHEVRVYSKFGIGTSIDGNRMLVYAIKDDCSSGYLAHCPTTSDVCCWYCRGYNSVEQFVKMFRLRSADIVAVKRCLEYALENAFKWREDAIEDATKILSEAIKKARELDANNDKVFMDEFECDAVTTDAHVPVYKIVEVK